MFARLCYIAYISTFPKACGINSFMSSWVCSMKILSTLISHWYAHTVWILWIYALFLLRMSEQSLIMFPFRLSYKAVCLRFRQSASPINNAATELRKQNGGSSNILITVHQGVIVSLGLWNLTFLHRLDNWRFNLLYIPIAFGW